MSLLKKLAGQTAIYGLSSIVGRLLNYLLVPIYTHSSMISTGEYGVSSWFYAFASFAAVIFTYGMETAFFRFYQKTEVKERVFSTAMRSLLVSTLLLSVLMITLAYPLSVWTKNEGRASFFFYFALILAADALTAIPFAWLRQKNQATRFALLKLLSIGLNIGLNLFFYILCPYLLHKGYSDISLIFDPKAGITYMFWANVISSLAVLPFFFKEFGMMRFGFDAALWREMLWYAFPLIFMGFAGMINETLDRMLLKALIADQAYAELQTGIYGACYKLSILMTLFIQAFRFAAEPFFFARAAEKDSPVMYARVMRYFVLVCSVIFVGVMLYLDVVKYFIGQKYWSGLSVVPILLMANLMLGIYYNLSIWYKLTDRTQLGAWVSIGGAVLTIVLNILWIPTLGFVGSAWATLICYTAMAVVSYVLGQKYFPVPYPLQRIALYLLLAIGVYVASDWLDEVLHISNFLQQFLLHSVLLILYLATLFGLERDELRYFFKKNNNQVP